MLEHSLVYSNVLKSLKYFPKLVPTQQEGGYREIANRALLRANFVPLRGNNALLTINMALLKFMDCVLKLKIRIYLCRMIISQSFPFFFALFMRTLLPVNVTTELLKFLYSFSFK